MIYVLCTVSSLVNAGAGMKDGSSERVKAGESKYYLILP